jgi:hypothetical protein
MNAGATAFSSLPALGGFAFALGVRHGMDADLGGLMLCTLVLPALSTWTDRHALLMSATVIVAIATAFLACMGTRPKTLSR